jgi:hypothetical protein
VEEVVLRLKELSFPSVADVAVLSVDANAEAVRVDARCTAAGAACPGCGAWSNRVHGSYLRFPADAGIGRDLDAVVAGLTLPWISGVVEGHVNRIKMLKRQMSGCAGFCLLRKRVLLAP